MTQRTQNLAWIKLKVMQRFRDYYANMLQAEIDSKKTDKCKEKYIKQKQDGLDLLIEIKVTSFLRLQSILVWQMQRIF